jgi:hypothetical protein
MIEPLLLEQLTDSLTIHERTAKIGFMFYEILLEAGYDDDEILEVADSMRDIVS